MEISITKKCVGCGKEFTFNVEETAYRQKSRRYCDKCRYSRKMINGIGVGARTTDIVRPKKKRNKKITLTEMDAFAKSRGLTYGQACALIESGAIEFSPVKIVKVKRENRELDITFCDIKKTNRDIFVKRMLKDMDSSVA